MSTHPRCFRWVCQLPVPVCSSAPGFLPKIILPGDSPQNGRGSSGRNCRDTGADRTRVRRFSVPKRSAYLTQHLKDMQNPEILKQDAGVPRFMKGYLARDYELFAVEKKDQKGRRRACI